MNSSFWSAHFDVQKSLAMVTASCFSLVQEITWVVASSDPAGQTAKAGLAELNRV